MCSLHHRHQQLLQVFAATADSCEDGEEQSDYSIAAVGSNRGGCLSQWSCGGLNHSKGGRGSQWPKHNGGSSQQEPSHSQLAKKAGICCNHFI